MRIPILLALAACDSLAGPDYVGPPLITLHGQFASSDEPPQSAQVSIQWQDAAGAGGPGLVSTSLPISIQPHAAFVAPIPSAPPAEALFQLADGEPRLAEGFIFIASTPNHMRGVVRDHVLVYAADDVLAGTRAAAYLGGPVSTGFHLVSYTPVTPPPASQADLVARCEASGSSATACEARRGYALAPVPSDDVLHVGLWPP